MNDRITRRTFVSNMASAAFGFTIVAAGILDTSSYGAFFALLFVAAHRLRVGEGGLVAMMSVSDEHRLVTHSCGHGGYD